MKIQRNFIESLSPRLGLKMIFIHTPKCGGSFVEKAFGERRFACPSIQWEEARGHRTYLEYRDIFSGRGQDLHDYVLFTVVRNPWDWHLSWYNYVSKDTDAKASGMAVEHRQIKDLSFSDYLKWLDDVDAERSKDDYMRKQVSDWIIDENGTLAIENVLRQEQLEDDLKLLRAKYRLRLNIAFGERVNSSRETEDYRLAYTDEDAERIAHRHARDVDLFGYEF
ncbi:sulfotransferase family 2 domain-containing protein [Rhizobium sp. F40D2]|uniref:sulfotransferase family 2 domain-containing protein n=1 Tax=Rhizobium sp. F40D2 TaxID=3453141 RepID=UPI003F296280